MLILSTAGLGQPNIVAQLAKGRLPSELFVASVLNSGTESQLIRFSATLIIGNQLPVEVSYQPIELAPGETRLTASQLPLESLSGFNDSVTESNGSVVVTARSYSIHVRAFDASGRMLGEERFSISPEQSGRKLSGQRDSAKDLMAIHGGTEIEILYGADPYLAKSSTTPMVTWQFSPELTLGVVPISADILVTSAAFPEDHARFSFDAQRFKQLLRERLESIVKKETAGIVKPGPKELQRLASLDAMLKDSTVTEQLMQSALLDSLESVATDQMVRSVEDSLQMLRLELESKADSVMTDSVVLARRKVTEERLSQLRERLAHLQKLRERARQLSEYKDRLEVLNKLKAERDTLRSKFDKVKQLTGVESLNLDDMNVLQSELARRSRLSELESKLTHLQNMQVGRFNPVVSPMSLWGTTLTGADVAVSTDQGYTLEVLAGRVSSATWFSADTSDMKPATLYGLIVGKEVAGQNQKFHFLYSPQVTTRSGLTYEKNRVFGTSLNANLLEGKVVLNGDAAYSLLRDESTAAAEPFITPSGALSLSNSRDIGDLAYSVQGHASLFKDRTKLKLKAKHVGPDYYSAGMPLLRSNTSSYEVRADQKLTKWLTVGAFTRQQDYGMAWDSTARFRNSGLSGRFTPTKSTMVQVEYAPAMNTTAWADQSELLMVTGFGRFRIGDISCYTVLNAMTMTNESVATPDSNSYSTRRIYADQGITISQAFSMNLNVMSSSSLWQGEEAILTQLGGAASFTKKLWSLQLAGFNMIQGSHSDWSGYVNARLVLKKSLTAIWRLQKSSYISLASLPQFEDTLSIIAALQWTW